MSLAFYGNVQEKVKIKQFQPCYEGCCQDHSKCEKKHNDYEMRKEVAKMFGVEHDFFKRVFQRKGQSKIMTKDEIAKVLLDNHLVENQKRALWETDILLTNGIGETIFWETKEKGKYQLVYKAPDYWPF
jgi:hypothetical protein